DAVALGAHFGSLKAAVLFEPGRRRGREYKAFGIEWRKEDADAFGVERDVAIHCHFAADGYSAANGYREVVDIGAAHLNGQSGSQILLNPNKEGVQRVRAR